jgi:2-hydroxy-3-keto-5-methylthiopentenyl-1-phosphate phosphatase
MNLTKRLKKSKTALLNEKNFTLQTVIRAISQERILLRPYAKEFLKQCMNFNLPLYIISGGLQSFLKKFMKKLNL